MAYVEKRKRKKGYGFVARVDGGSKSFDTAKEAWEWIDERERHPDYGDVTVAEFVEVWLRDYPRKARDSQRTYRYATTNFVATHGHLPLAGITRPMARKWAKEHRHNARVIKTMYGDAVRDGIVHENPFANLRLEQPRGRRDITALTMDQVNALVSIAREVHGDTLACMVAFGGYVGLRPGEICALQYAGVDYRNLEVLVRHTVDSAGSLKPPKNGKERVVTLPPAARDAFLLVPRHLDTPWAFHTNQGRQFRKASLAHYWKDVRSAFGRPSLAFYELRHACATMLLELGMTPADAAVQLGHTDGGRLVQMLYGHPDQDLARERLKRAFSPVHPIRAQSKRET